MKSKEFKVEVSPKLRSIAKCMVQFKADPYLYIFWRKAFKDQMASERMQ